MTLINVIANNEVVEDLLVRDILTVENRADCSNLTIRDNITLAPGATFDGSFIKDFEETDTYLDENNVEITTTETIDLYEKIERIESKIDANTTSHANNAAAIASRYTKTAADLRFVSNTDAKITGDLKIRATETEPYVSLTAKLGEKVNNTTLNAYILANDGTTKENADAIESNTEAIQTKVDKPPDFGTSNLTTYIDARIPAPVDISGKQDIPAAGESFALTSSIPDVSSFITLNDISGKQDIPVAGESFALTSSIPDVSNKVDKPADFGTNTLDQYIQLKAPVSTSPTFETVSIANDDALILRGTYERLNDSRNTTITQTFTSTTGIVKISFSIFDLGTSSENSLRFYKNSTDTSHSFLFTGRTIPADLTFETTSGTWSIRSSGRALPGFRFTYYDVNPDVLGLSVNGGVDVGGSLTVNGVPVVGLTSTVFRNFQFQNGWQHYGFEFNPGSYRRDGLGRTHLRGLVRYGSGVITNLPLGFRPPRTELFGIHATGGEGRIDVRNNGDVVFQGGNNQYVQLDGLSFDAVF